MKLLQIIEAARQQSPLLGGIRYWHGSGTAQVAWAIFLPQPYYGAIYANPVIHRYDQMSRREAFETLRQCAATDMLLCAMARLQRHGMPMPGIDFSWAWRVTVNNAAEVRKTWAIIDSWGYVWVLLCDWRRTSVYGINTAINSVDIHLSPCIPLERAWILGDADVWELIELARV